MDGVTTGHGAGDAGGQRPPTYVSSRFDPVAGDSVGNESSSSDSSSSSRGSRRGRATRSPRALEYKKAAEKKFRHRYLLLQQAYEQRLQALAAQVRHVVTELQSDSTIEYLQQDPLTHEYAGARVAEIIQECFSGEREKYVKLVSDQIAWQTNDLREAHVRIRSLQKREKTAQSKWRHAQHENQQLERQRELLVREMGERTRDVERLEDSLRKVEDERDSCRVELDRVRPTAASFEKLRHEYEMLQVRCHNEREQERAVHDSLKQQMDQLREERQQIDTARLGVERDNQHLRHMLKTAEAKSDELANALRQVQAEEYSTRLLRMEHEAAQQRHENEQLVKENEQLKKKYEEFGVQVELYMEEQSRERATVVKQAEERERKLLEELALLRTQSTDAIKMKQNELLRLADQVKFRQDVLVKAEHKISVLEERISGLETSLGEEKLRSARTISDLEKEVAHWTAAVEREQERVKSAEAAHAQTKLVYEQRLAVMQETLDQQLQHSLKERELEERTKWQNDFVAKQEARIEALKNKYDAALESQQTELLRSRQVAMDAAKAAAEKVEEVKAFHQSQRIDEEEVRRLRDEARDAERRRVEAERTRDAAYRKQQKEIEERDKRIREMEQKLAERERHDDRRRAADEARAKEHKADRPSVVVLNVNGTDELDEHEEKVGSQAIAMVKRHKKTPTGARMPPRTQDDNQEAHYHDDCVPIAQHRAELQAREAQVALEAEKRLQKEIHDFQERKEKELRNAMVNVRKGIQKLEASLETEKSDKKRIEEELHSERQGFVALKSEMDDMRMAKRTLAQRLEEANGHLGRLRDVVKEAQQKVSQSETRLETATREARHAEKTVAELKTKEDDLRQAIADLRDSEARLEAELRTSLNIQQDLETRLRTAEQERALQEERFQKEHKTQSECHANEVNRVSSELSARIQTLESQLVAQSGEAQQLLEQVEGGSKSMEQLVADRLVVERALEGSKSELAKQRKEFNDLARLHKNLSETMKARIGQEQERYARLAEELEIVKRSRDSIQRAKRTALEICRTRLQELHRECRDLRKATASEYRSAWKTTKKELLVHAKGIEALVGRAFEKEKAAWETTLRLEREQWRSRLEAKDQEMNALITGEKIDGQAKYTQLADRLTAKSQEVQDLERQSAAQGARIDELQRTIQRLEEQNESRMQEQSQLVNQLSSSRVVTDREVEAKQQLQQSVAKVASVAQVFLDFVRKIMKEFALDPRKILTVLNNGLKDPETWKPDSLSSDLGRVFELLQERMTAKEMAAVDLASRPLQNELNAARDALLPLATQVRSDADDHVTKHLPWYVAVVRSVKQQMEQLRHEADALRKTVDEKTARVNDVEGSLAKLQQIQASLLFEKDTLSHELHVQLQTLQKRRDSDFQQQKDDYERKADQMQRRHTTEQLKANEEHEVMVEQLKVALEAEKKAHSKLKQDMMVARVEHDKLKDEFQDRTVKVEKELEVVRDELAKWKRKAKLSASKSPGTPSRRPSVMFSSPFHQTDDDASDGSFQSMFPVSRRPSSAMADLSNLMEQSLHDLRKDNEGMFATPLQQPSPTPRLLQSPMRRASGTARPSPLRIPMYPSPARKRTSLVPPPKLISTVTSQGLPPQVPSAPTIPAPPRL